MNDGIDLNSKYLLSFPSISSPQQLHLGNQIPSQRLQSQCNYNSSVDNNNNNNNKIMKPRRNHSSPSPAPFLSFLVENENCAVYVGNIPLDDRTPCKICCESDDSIDDNSNININDEDCCACKIELKAFLRDRINTAFKVPVEKIGIRKCRLFSVVTNVYSNSDVTVDTTENNEGGGDGSSSLKSSIPSNTTTNTNTNATNNNNTFRQQPRSGRRRLHRAACVEFDDPKIAEQLLALKFTSFHFDGQPHNRASLRMRRWTTQPSPPSSNKSLSAIPIQQHAHTDTPLPPRSKSVSPKISEFNWKQLPPPPRPKSVSPNIVGRKQQHQQQQQQQQMVTATTISERASSPVPSPVNADTIGNPTDDPNFKFGTRAYYSAASDGGRPSSPSCSSSCAIYVGNIPSDATSENLREFFLERMNKAFHGVTPPEIISLGMRHCTSSANGGPHTDACVEFQEPEVAFRATQLKNRRWHVKKQQDETTIDEKSQNNDEERGRDGADDTGNSTKNRNSMSLLEIEIWDLTKYDTSDFFHMNENDTNVMGAKNNAIVGSTFTKAEDNDDDVSRSDMLEDGIDATRKLKAKTSPKTSPSLLRKVVPTIEEAREGGFLICTNANKTPKFDHIFVVEDQQPHGEEDDNCQGEVKKARMCHGCAFRGKVCLTHKKKKKVGNSKISNPGVCQFAHIDSFDQLKDLHDVLSLLYYVENNDEVEFVPGIGCTPREYLLRQREGQPNTEVGTFPTETTQLNQQIDSSSIEEMLRELRSDLSVALQDLSTTQQQLLNSERSRQSLLEQQTMQVVHNAAEYASTNKSLKDEVSRLRNNLQETNQKWEASELALENNKRDYALSQEKYQHQKGKYQVSTERLKLEAVGLREEVQQSRADYELLKHHQRLSASPTSHTYLEDSWPDSIQLDNFLERSIPTLMQMTDGNDDELPQLHLPPKLIDIPLDHSPSCHTPYKSAVACNPKQPPGFSPTKITKKATPTDEDSLRSEISYLMSCYGNQVSATNGASPIVTRFLKLPMSQYKGRDIDVALQLTLPKGYPWNGIVKVDSDPRLSNHFGANSQCWKIVSESVSGLLNMCRWEAEACQGKPHVLINVMKSAERWVQNDWKVIQKKNWVIDHDLQEHPEGSLLLSV